MYRHTYLCTIQIQLQGACQNRMLHHNPIWGWMRCERKEEETHGLSVWVSASWSAPHPDTLVRMGETNAIYCSLVMYCVWMCVYVLCVRIRLLCTCVGFVLRVYVCTVCAWAWAWVWVWTREFRPKFDRICSFRRAFVIFLADTYTPMYRHLIHIHHHTSISKNLYVCIVSLIGQRTRQTHTLPSVFVTCIHARDTHHTKHIHTLTRVLPCILCTPTYKPRYTDPLTQPQDHW